MELEKELKADDLFQNLETLLKEQVSGVSEEKKQLQYSLKIGNNYSLPKTQTFRQKLMTILRKLISKRDV